MEVCRRDPLFWINTFVFTYDPRLVEGGRKPLAPFITYAFQDDAFLEMNAACGKEDVFIEKSRDMGASWLLITLFVYRWLFRDLESFLLVSRKEELVDKSGDPKSLFWKIDFILKRLPKWMIPRHTRIKLHLHNDENGSTIDGESTNGDVARGDRRTAIGLDEFASVENGHEVLAATGDATNSRFFNSTPKGTGNAFYVQREKTKKRIRMHWSQHPVKARGLYTADEGTLKIVDVTYPFPANYKFITDGKLRSPWYDRECERRSHKLEVAQELDIDYLGSAYTFFDNEKIQQLLNQYARTPLLTGELEYDPFRCIPERFTRAAGDDLGKLRFWVPMIDGRPPRDRSYVIGGDVAMGTGASNSVLSVWCRMTGQKVAEYADPYIRPEEFGRFAIAVCRWFEGADGQPAYLIPEGNGPGIAFCGTVLEHGFRNIFYHRTKEGSLDEKQTLTPGWASTKDTRLKLLGDYREMLVSGKALNFSRESFQEAMEYIVHTDGQVLHSAAANSIDPSGARDNHGDRVIADALACKVLREKPAYRIAESAALPVGSFGWRQQQARLLEKRQKAW